jgi:hypothetical protein
MYQDKLFVLSLIKKLDPSLGSTLGWSFSFPCLNDKGFWIDSVILDAPLTVIQYNYRSWKDVK